MRNALSLIVLLTLTFAGVGSFRAAEPEPDGSTSLADAVKAFNERALEDPIGKEQPPLTEAEVIAAIRWSDSAPQDSCPYRMKNTALFEISPRRAGCQRGRSLKC